MRRTNEWNRLPRIGYDLESLLATLGVVLDPAESNQVRADKVLLALAVSPRRWPRSLKRLFRDYRPTYRQLVEEFFQIFRAERFGPSYNEELVWRLLLRLVGNSKRWFQRWVREGAKPQVEWISLDLAGGGLAITDLHDKLLKDEWDSIRTGSADDAFPTDLDVDGGVENDRAFELTGWDHDLLDETLLGLTPLEERVLRLRHALFRFPTQRWSFEKLAKRMSRTSDEIEEIYWSAVSKYTTLLQARSAKNQFEPLGAVA